MSDLQQWTFDEPEQREGGEWVVLGRAPRHSIVGPMGETFVFGRGATPVEAQHRAIYEAGKADGLQDEQNFNMSRALMGVR